MPAVYPIQTSFVGGELSPRLRARVDSEKYRVSVAKMRNFFPLPQGSAFKRGGSQFFFETENNGPARLVDFGRGRQQDYVVEFTDLVIRMYNRDGVVQAAGGEELFNPEFSQGSSGLLGWTVDSFLTQLVDIGGELVDITVMEFEANSPNFNVTQLADAVGDDGSPPNFVHLSQEMTVDEDPLNPGTWLPHTLTADYVFDGTGNEFAVTLKIGDGTTEDAYDTVVYDPDTTGNGTFSVDFTPLVATVTVKWEFRMPITPTVSPNFATIRDLSLKPQINDPLLLTSPYSGTQLFELDVVMDLGAGSDNDRLWIVHPDVEPQLLTRISENNWELYPLITGAGPDPVFIMPPPVWVADNYPATVELFAGRSWFSGVPSDRARLWGSKAGDYFDFTPGSNPGNSLDQELVTRGSIQWIKGQKALLLGTDLAEHTVTSTVSFNALQVGDIDVFEQSANGSPPIEPIIIGSEVVYISPDGTKLYGTDYLRDNDGWISYDLSWNAEHITKENRDGNLDNRILRHTWARDPNNQIQCVMEDGTITQLVYDKRFDTVAWSSQETQGDYISMCATNDLSGSSKWYCVKRGDNYYVETVQAGEINNEYMDSWASSPTVDNVVSGLDHLEGLEVQVLVNGAVEPNKTVTGGEITTEGSGTAIVGLEYVATLGTLRTEGGNQAGSSQLSEMDFYEVVLRLNRSAVPAVNGRRPSLRDPQTPMNTPTPLTTGDSQTFQLEQGSKGQLTITQELPLRTEITAVYGKLGSDVI